MKMRSTFDELEIRRSTLQVELDAKKTPAERNRLGQFSTPSALADDILAYAKTLFSPDWEVRFLDQQLGPAHSIPLC